MSSKKNKDKVLMVYAGRCHMSSGKIGYRYLRIDKKVIDLEPQHFLEDSTREVEECIFGRKVVKCGLGNQISAVNAEGEKWGDFKWEGLPDDKVLMDRAVQMGEVFEHQLKKERAMAKSAPSVLDEVVKMLGSRGYFDLKWNDQMYWISALTEKLSAEERRMYNAKNKS